MKSLTVNRGACFACAFSLFCMLALLTAAPAFASPGAGDSFEDKQVHLASTAHTTSSSDASGSIVRTIVGLAIVVAVIYGLYWIMKQAKGSKNAPAGEGLEQVATLPLGGTKAVTLVRVGGELHMLGIGEHAITALRIFTEEEAYELGLPMESDGPISNGSGQPPIQRMVDGMRRFTGR